MVTFNSYVKLPEGKSILLRTMVGDTGVMSSQSSLWTRQREPLGVPNESFTIRIHIDIVNPPFLADFN